MDTSVAMRWLGVAGIELSVDGRTLVIDPFVSRPPARRLWAGRVASDGALVAEKVPYCDVVLVTHAHWDHIMDVPEVARRTGAAVYGSPNACALLQALGVAPAQLHRLAAGDRLRLGAFAVEVLPAVHRTALGRPIFTGPLRRELAPPLRLRDYRMDLDFSFAVGAAGYRLLAWSSERAAPAVAADILCVKPFATRPAFYAELLRAVRPRLVIPIHWDGFLRPLSKPLRPMLRPPCWSMRPLRRVDLAEFRQVIQGIAPGTAVFVPEIFRSYDLGDLLGAVASTD
jgi:L-ascorbate metabolism protein UlaG (beta-lactamase superfamily)